MRTKPSSSPISRRQFLKMGMGFAAAGLATGVMGKRLLNPIDVVRAAGPAPDLHLAGTDGWVSMPVPPAIPPYHPDDLAPNPFTTYIFGFADVTGMTPDQVLGKKEQAQLSAPLVWMDENVDFRLQLSNLGLAVRPDLIDSHTFHFHGFRNAIPAFDGEPTSSISVPIGRDLTYLYRPHNPGTYMYHCHFEDVEHVHMGMTGIVYIRPAQNQNPLNPGEKYAYNDGDGSTRYDREFPMLFTELWAFAHWCDSHIQLPEWSDYKPDFFLINGRTYPDTLEPNGDPNSTAAGRLQYQPYSSLVTANSGERVLLRMSNLGFQIQSLTVPGLKLHVVGKDATLMRGRDGTDTSFWTNTISLAPGESVDAIFEAPHVSSPTTYLLYNRDFNRASNGNPGHGGQMTEIRIYPAGTLPAQSQPNA